MHKFKADYLAGFMSLRYPKILDVGCFSGQFHRALKIRHQYYGVDIDKDIVDYMNGRDKSGQYRVGSAAKVPYRRSFFDVAIFSEVIEHVPKHSELKSLKELHRVLKKNGILFLSTPLDNWLSKLLDPAFWLIGHRHYEAKEVISMLEKAGFEILIVREIGSFWHSLGHLIELTFKHLNLGSPTRLIKYFEGNSERLLRSADNGYLSVIIIAKKL
ncbi:MAG: hypothetical protein US96_C0006G0023 [Candidatus Woesebacteria bacterium GW2011_GWB1_38_5b]|uniref:Methyltransferase type 11 domain-containing protein n=1 Tax=Candidatus Woesebacteria bacterium GW2011_GWB1_38_5b TaxID=1618569 RepID=A0A0G0NF43_9BACT|nr:MAG: hypothetical protein US96_C0006G0023 [Candidatus Woesebacteria bacterium GW2011_GWB1_38_5b]